MTNKMLKFVKIGQQSPPKRETEVRKKDFNEIYASLSLPSAVSFNQSGILLLSGQ